MITTTVVKNDEPEFVKLELRTAYGPVFRDVSTKPPREATAEEIPIIDLGSINGTFEKRQMLAEAIKQASENIGFFYIRNFGISEQVIDDARETATRFFKQPLEDKMKISRNRSQHYNGYHANGTSKASRTEGST